MRTLPASLAVNRCASATLQQHWHARAQDESNGAVQNKFLNLDWLRTQMPERKSNSASTANGTVREIDGKQKIYFDGYWIRYYEPPPETLTKKKNLIGNLTRRTFHHTEPGINTPGENLDLARAAYEKAFSKAEKRVNAAMLAGALFNRATDIFTTIVDLESKGVQISFENELMKECSDCLEEAMQLGASVRHISGMEGVDELWGEPLKAFSMSIHDFYCSRYVKISMTMRDIDAIHAALRAALQPCAALRGIWPVFDGFSEIAKRNCETMKIDPDYFSIWPKFVTLSDQILQMLDAVSRPNGTLAEPHLAADCELVRGAHKLITYVSGLRVPMPEATERFLDRCQARRAAGQASQTADRHS